jgi:hypothetical protein
VKSAKDDMNKILRAAKEAKQADTEIVNSVLRIAKQIASIAPEEWINRPLGRGYIIVVNRVQEAVLTKKLITGSYIQFDVPLSVRDARDFAHDVEQGFLADIRLQIESYRNAGQRYLTDIKAGERLLNL